MATAPAELSYQGKPLRFWLGCFEPGLNGMSKELAAEMTRMGGPLKAREKVLAGITQMGDPAYASLARMLEGPTREISPLRAKWLTLLIHLPFGQGLVSVPARKRKEEIVNAFQALGTNAASAAPQLRAILDNAGPGPYTREFVMWSLVAVDPRSCISLLKHRDSLVRFMAADALGSCQSDCDRVLSALRECLMQDDEYLRRKALWSIARIHRTPMICAAQEHDPQFVKLLHARGADINSRDETGSALTWAVESGNEEVVKFLITNGANVGSTNWFGETPLDIAARIKRAGLISILKQWSQTGAEPAAAPDAASPRR